MSPRRTWARSALTVVCWGEIAMSMVPTLDQIDVGAAVDQRHHLASPQAFGEHPGEDVDLVVIGGPVIPLYKLMRRGATHASPLQRA